MRFEKAMMIFIATGRILLDKRPILIAMNGYERTVGHRLRGLDMAVVGHGGDDAERVAGAEDVAALLLDHLDFLGDAHLARSYDEEAVSVLLPLHDDIRVLFEVDERELERTIHRVS